MKRFDLLRSPLLPALVAVLVLNDFVLKPIFANWVTGKLSDFAGLAAFTIFLLAIWPRRARLVATSVTIFFVFWKSPWSQGLIDWVNVISPIGIGRTVDWSDLIALTAVDLVCRTADRLPLLDASKLRVWLTAGGCLVAFAATSYAPGKPYGHSRTVEIPPPAGGSQLESEIGSIFDDVAARHALRCGRCDSLDVGRSYLGIGGMQFIGAGDLEVSFDPSRRLIYYRIQVHLREPPTTDDAGKKARVDAIDADIEAELRRSFPMAIFRKSPLRPAATYRTVLIKVAKKEEAEQVAAVVAGYYLTAGFRRNYQSEAMQSLVQPPPVNHSDLALKATILTFRNDTGFTVQALLTSAAPEYAARQDELFEALARKLSLEFGAKNVSIQQR